MPLNIGIWFSTVRGRLALLVIVALLPALIISLALLVYLTQKHDKEIREASVGTLRAVFSAVENELSRSKGIAEALAASSALHQSDINRFKNEAARVLELQPTWRGLVLYAPDGTQLFNLGPTGENARRTVAERGSFEKVVATRNIAIGDVFMGRTTKEPLFAIRVPVFNNGKLAYVVSPTIKPDSLRTILEEQDLGSDGVMSIIDSAGTIVARSRNHANYVGKSPSPDFWNSIRGRNEGWIHSTTLDGYEVETAHVRSASSGWTMIYGVSDNTFHTVSQSYLIVLAALVFCLGLGFLAAMLLAKQIANPIRELSAAAKDFGAGQTMTLPGSSIDELRALEVVLLEASANRHQAEIVLEDSLKQAEAARLEAERANLSKDEFLAMLGHELRNPLAPISNAVEAMRRQSDMPPHSTRARELITRQLSQLTRLVDDLLDISRVTRGVIELKKEKIDLRTVVDRALETCRPLLDSKKHQFHMAIAEEALIVDGGGSLTLTCLRLISLVTGKLTANFAFSGPDFWR